MVGPRSWLLVQKWGNEEGQCAWEEAGWHGGICLGTGGGSGGDSMRSGPQVGERAEQGLKVPGICWSEKGFSDIISKASSSCNTCVAKMLSSNKAHF